MLSQTVQRTTALARLNVAHLAATLTLAVGLVLSSSLLAEPAGSPRSCDLAGTWYGGSVVAYHMTIIPDVEGGHYAVSAQGMYKDSVMNTMYTGQVARKHNRFEGPLMQLSTSDPDFLNPPPLIGKMPDIIAAWTSMKLVDCNTIENRIPFFGLYFGRDIWQPGIVWISPAKTPLLDAPDVDLLDVIAGGMPIVETYHRVLETVNPALLHKK